MNSFKIHEYLNVSFDWFGTCVQVFIYMFFSLTHFELWIIGISKKYLNYVHDTDKALVLYSWIRWLWVEVPHIILKLKRRKKKNRCEHTVREIALNNPIHNSNQWLSTQQFDIQGHQMPIFSMCEFIWLFSRSLSLSPSLSWLVGRLPIRDVFVMCIAKRIAPTKLPNLVSLFPNTHMHKKTIQITHIHECKIPFYAIAHEYFTWFPFMAATYNLVIIIDTKNSTKEKKRSRVLLRNRVLFFRCCCFIFSSK